MTITAAPTAPANPLDRTADATLSEIDALHAVRGYDVDLSPEQQVLGSILRTAIYHDTVCQHLEAKMYRKLGLHGYSHEKEHDDGDLLDYVAEAVQVSAVLAAAALRRIPSIPVFVKAAAGKGAIEELCGDDLEAFMRPIFEDSGIGERFEVRTGYQVYRDPEATRSN